MNGGHDSGNDRIGIVESLCHGSEAVCGAGCSRDDLVVLGKDIVVDVVNDGLQVVSGGSGDDNLLCACLDVSH